MVTYRDEEPDTARVWAPRQRLVLRTITATNFNSQIQQLQALPNSPRPVSQSPNTATAKNPTYSGLPLPVSNVRAARQVTKNGITTVISFTRDASDPYFEKVNVWARNYKGNQTPILVASSQSSPVRVALDRTGEHVTLYVQASSKAGDAQLLASPTSSISLQ